jgi:hypothetical protein
MDRTGAVIGPLFVGCAVARSHTFGPAFLALGIPALLALAAVGVAWHFRPRDVTPPSLKPPQPLPQLFWIYVLASGLLAAGFLDFTMLGFHFQRTRLFEPQTIPYLYAGAMGVVGITALVCGRLFDRHGVVVLAFGVLVTMLALPLGFLGGRAEGVLAVICWAAGHGVQDATLRAGIAQVVQQLRRVHAWGLSAGVTCARPAVWRTIMKCLGANLIALVVFRVAFKWHRRLVLPAAASARGAVAASRVERSGAWCPSR